MLKYDYYAMLVVLLFIIYYDYIINCYYIMIINFFVFNFVRISTPVLHVRNNKTYIEVLRRPITPNENNKSISEHTNNKRNTHM